MTKLKSRDINILFLLILISWYFFAYINIFRLNSFFLIERSSTLSLLIFIRRERSFHIS
jgi:hypothetical protein